jgi:hypothetical protein
VKKFMRDLTPDQVTIISPKSVTIRPESNAGPIAWGTSTTELSLDDIVAKSLGLPDSPEQVSLKAAVEVKTDPIPQTPVTAKAEWHIPPVVVNSLPPTSLRDREGSDVKVPTAFVYPSAESVRSDTPTRSSQVNSTGVSRRYSFINATERCIWYSNRIYHYLFLFILLSSHFIR